MKKYVIVHKHTGEIEYAYEHFNKRAFGGPFAKKERYVHVELPADIDPEFALIELNKEVSGEVSGSIIFKDVVTVDEQKLSGSVDFLKNIKKQEVNSEYDSKLNDIALKYYPENERLAFNEKLQAAQTWHGYIEAEKESEISGFISNQSEYTGDCLILLAECELSGDITQTNVEEVDDLTGVIFENSRRFRFISGNLTKQRKNFHSYIDSVPVSKEGFAELKNFEPLFVI